MSPRNNSRVTLSVTLLHETPKAYFVHDGIKDGWVPKSQVTLTESEIQKGEEIIYDLDIPEWLAEDKEFI
jgi:hypothetical protein